jgi:hypothetical protein
MFPCCARIVLGRCTDRGLSREFAWDGGKLEALTRIKSAMSSPPTPLCSVSSACSNPPVAKPSINGCYFAHSFRRRNRPGMAASGRGRSVADRRSSHRERSRPGAPERAADFGASVATAIHHRAHRPSAQRALTSFHRPATTRRFTVAQRLVPFGGSIGFPL